MFNKIKRILNKYSGEEAVIKIDEVLSPIFDKNMKKLSKAELNFCLIEILEREVNSGGFNDYFSYDYGNYALETLDALSEIKSIKFKAIFEKAMNVFEPYNKNEEERYEIIESNEEDFEKTWNELEEQFYNYEEDIHSLLLDYVSKNIKQFR